MAQHVSRAVQCVVRNSSGCRGAGGESNRTGMVPPQGLASHCSASLFSRGVVVTMYPDRAARQMLLEGAQDPSKDGQNPRMNPLERKSGGSITSELMREGFSRDGLSGVSGISAVSKPGSSSRLTQPIHGSAVPPHASAGPLPGSLWGARAPARGENRVVHATVSALVQVCSTTPQLPDNRPYAAR